MRIIFLLTALFISGCAGIQGALFDMGVASERSRSAMVQRHVEIGGRRIHYLERAGPEPDSKAIVLLHGFGGNKDHWIRFTRFLPPCYRVLAPDLPGHGDNAPDTTASYTISFFTEAVSSFVGQIVEGPVHVVGNSLGGEIAAELALAHPELVNTLSLLNPAGLISPEPSELDQALANGENLLIPTNRTEYDRFTSIAFGDEPPKFPWPTASVISHRYAERAPLYRRMWQDLFSEAPMFESRLSDLTLPVEVIWGDRDGILDVSAAAWWAELILHAELEILPGVGHAPMLERPQETAELVSDFIGRSNN